ncbi:hypothetical protein O6D23_03060 [Legionella pneumophila]|uniref:hypothetical protein n=1 Tax=Legionella pneumophila TaxID=446 RepID=UPI0022B413D2|nr:hypothetical protein [Legionella pneumophila]MCZ4786735.1 hypothetical protein [Legionella pneumophila]
MALYLIQKYKLDKSERHPVPQVYSQLTERERALLIDFFILDGLLTSDEKKEVLHLCRTIHERDLWIQCDCLNGRLQPVFRFNRASSGSLYLHHITSRAEHSQQCVFKERIWTAQERKITKTAHHIKKLTPLNLVPKKSIGMLALKKEEKSQKNTPSSANRRSSLCQALYRLLDDAGVNVISSTNKVSPFKAIEQAALSIEIQPKKKLRDYLYINPPSFYKAAYMLKADQTYWSKEIRKHALMLVKVKEFHERVMEVFLPDGATQKIEISNRIYCSSGRFSPRTPPFMALILITDSTESPNYYQPFNAFIVPCYSEKTFIPVDSYYEREVLRRLFALQFEWTQKGWHLEIIKPLFDIEIKVDDCESEREGVLPDFILRTPTKQLIIEVNGSHEPEYLQRKQRVHQKMGQLGTVLSFDAYGAEKEDRLNFKMSKFIVQIKNHLTDIG